MKNERSLAERILALLAYAGLMGGILTGFLVAKGIWESNTEMCFPAAVATFLGYTAASVVGWAVLIVIVGIADRLREIESKLDK